MKFSNTTYGFYPSEQELLERYSNLPDDLVEVSDSDYVSFLNNELGDNVQIIDGSLVTREVSITVDYEAKARKLRNSIRSEIDNYLLPSSTINDILVTDEQKQTLIQDSVLLAGWPAVEGWPYIQLPVLSDLCQSLITIPVWEYPIQNIEISV